MHKVIAFILEVFLSLCALWLTSFFSTLLHELGHAAGYMLSTGGRRWHIRVGSGKRLFETKLLTVKLFVFDGCFTPSEKKFDTKAKLVSTLLGGPAASLLTVAGLLALRFGGLSFRSDFFAEGVVEFFLNTAIFINLGILILSILPVRYFWGETRGMETDGLKIIKTIKDGRKP
ncbi:MAG: hypothetical protein J5849_07510 [Clostridia bacterium]|nr:hypothetical protein [Clostridia bacterium]